MKSAALSYLALAMLLAYPLSVHPASRVMADAPDTQLYVWTLSWDVHALTHQPLAMFDANIFYPERRTLAYSENLLGSALMAAPVLWGTGNPVLAMNVVLLASAVLCGAGVFLLARRLGIGAPGALVAGAIFAFSPPRFLRLDQVHLATIQWVPFSLAYLHTYLERRRPRDLRIALGFFSLQVLTSGHGAAFLAVAFAGLLVYAAVRSSLRLGQAIADAGVPGLLVSLPMVFVTIPYLLVQREVGLRRTLEDWHTPAADFLASPAHLHGLLLSLMDARINETANAYLFPGFLPVLFAALAFLVPDRRDDRDPRPHGAGALTGGISDPRLYYALLAILCLWISASRPVSLWPYIYWLPGFNFVRVPSRFMMLGLMGLAVLAGFGFDRLLRRWPSLPPGALAMAALLLLAAEFAAIPLDTAAWSVEVPAIDRWLDTRAKPFAVAEVPLPDPSESGRSERRQTAYMLHSTAHWQKTVHGYSGFATPAALQRFSRLARFPTAESIEDLRRIGVGYVVVHLGDYAEEEREEVERRLGEAGGSLTLVHEEPDGRVYAVNGSARTE